MQRVKETRDLYSKEEKERIDKMIEEVMEHAEEPDNWIPFEDVMKKLDERISAYAKKKNHILKTSRN